MGRLLMLVVVIAAALAGVWFFVPGGKDMIGKYLPKSAEEAAPAAIVEQPAAESDAAATEGEAAAEGETAAAEEESTPN